MKAEKTDRKEQVQELTKKLEDGITALFESDRYLEYLTIMARFHHYSYRNTLLILLQCPDATLVAGFHAWKQKFGRHVKKGETGICILAPMAYKYKKESKKQDQEVVILEPESEDTKHTKKAEQSEELEEKSEQRIVGFRVVRVFDVTQTEGKELPQLGVDELTGAVTDYEVLIQALLMVSPMPVSFIEIESGAKGYCNVTKRVIAIQKDMSQLQTVKTMIHGYEDGIQGLNGLTVTNITKNGFTIIGTPASDVNITLPPATKAVYSMLLSGDGTFTGTCVGYQPINAKEFTITNSGNVDLENVDISITGTDKDKFELSGDGTTTIQPNDTLKVAVAPKDSLATGIYRATLTVTAANAQIATTELQFTVNEHDYVAVVTPPNCTEKGYTTYTCRNCSHSYKGNEVDATGHTWGEWKVIKEATTTETGKKERVCERCDYKEIAVISMISNKEQPTTSTKPDTAVKTGDSTNILLWSMVMVISLAGMLTALFFKRRRNR